jgi:site-specific recombinase XerD
LDEAAPRQKHDLTAFAVANILQHSALSAIKRYYPGKPFATLINQNRTEVTMNTSMPTHPQFAAYYQKHQKSLKLCGLQPKTIEAYSRAIRRIANYFDSRIDDLTSEQLLEYFHDLLDRHSWSTVKLDLYGLKFFYSRVLNKTWEEMPLIKPPKTSRIPDILSVEQLNRLFGATNKLSYRVFFFTSYSMGLRLGEGIRLTVGDIDSTNMRVHIRDAKGNKDRLVPLPEKTLHTLKAFWRVHKHPNFLFPSRKRGLKNVGLVKQPLDRGGIQAAMKSITRDLGIKKNFMPLLASQLCNPYAGGRC